MGVKQSTVSSNSPEVVLTRVSGSAHHHNNNVDTRPRQGITEVPRHPPPPIPERDIVPQHSRRIHRLSEDRRSHSPPSNNDIFLNSPPSRSSSQVHRSSSLQQRPLPPLPPPLPPSQRQNRHGSERRHRGHESSQQQEWHSFLQELGFPPPPPHFSSRPLPPLPRHETFSGRGQLSEHSIADNPLVLLRELTRRKCPVCSQIVPHNDYERHLSQCMAGPSIQFNEDRLLLDAGECSICLEDMLAGDEIARLPCLCVYHIKCIGEWFRVKEECPQHPDLKIE